MSKSGRDKSLIESNTRQQLRQATEETTVEIAPGLSKLKDFLQLTKPRIMLLVLMTAVAALVMEGSMITQPLRLLLFLLGLFLTGGSANAFNQYLERDIDSHMSRTVRRRPLPTGRLKPLEALLFATAIGASGVLLLGLVFNWLTAALSLGTILFYAFIYTLLLKPNTYLNTVIGGAAGAMAPVGAWAAATGGTTPAPWAIFMIVFLWTPPHFWSLALICEKDYQRVRLPMLPVVKGVDNTLTQILLYTLALVLVSLTPLLLGAGVLYGVTALILGIALIRRAVQAKRSRGNDRIRSLFHFSIVYLLTLLIGLILDQVLMNVVA
jgi:protoheme IX farnesyltransferase